MCLHATNVSQFDANVVWEVKAADLSLSPHYKAALGLVRDHLLPIKPVVLGLTTMLGAPTYHRFRRARASRFASLDTFARGTTKSPRTPPTVNRYTRNTRMA